MNKAERMADISKYKSESEEIAAFILTDRQVFEKLWVCVLSAGQATEKSSFVKAPNDICVLPLNRQSINRNIIPIEIKSYQSIIQYRAEDLTVIGGAAINAIDMVTQHDTNVYMRTHTTDMDVVWWPRVSSLEFMKFNLEKFSKYRGPFQSFLTDRPLTERADSYAITSTSPQIIKVVELFALRLQAELNSLTSFQVNQALLMSRTRISNSGFYFEVSRTPTTVNQSDPSYTYETDRMIRSALLSGAWSVTATLRHKTHPLTLKLIDIAIHDGASSQKQPNVKPFDQALMSMETDPVYASKVNRTCFQLAGIESLSIPHLDRLVYQQNFALENRIQAYWRSHDRTEDAKHRVQTHRRRIEYLLDVITIAIHSRQGKSPYILPYLSYMQQILQIVPEYYSAFLNNTVYSLQNKPEWVAACPWSAETCKQLHTSNVFQELCREGKMLEPEFCIAKETKSPQNRR